MGKLSYSVGKLKAPSGSGELLTVPTLDACPDAARRNSQSLSQDNVILAGRPLQEFRTWTRSVLLEMAANFTGTLFPARLLRDAPPDSPLFVTGHQPTLSHPGVWAKNLATFRLAQGSEGVGLNLIVDNDTVDRCSIDLPSGTPSAPRFRALEFDRPTERRPWEERQIRDLSVFQNFGAEVTNALKDWQITPVLSPLWPVVLEKSKATRNLCELLTVTRLLLEQQYGVTNLELPLSRLSQSRPFLSFLADILCKAERFRQVYNASLADYRREYRLHSSRHPVPDLELHASSIELPFWAWRQDDPQRQRLFVKQTPHGIELLAGQTLMARLVTRPSQDAPEQSDLSDLVSQLEQVQKGWKIRPRALVTTLFSRLALADLFIHGIGGARYDEVTDRIIDNFYGIQPPTYGVVTATMYLPPSGHDVSKQSILTLQRRLREMNYNPYAFLTGPEIQELVQERDVIVSGRNANAQTSEDGRQRHQRLLAIRASLSARLIEEKLLLQAELHQAQSQLAANKVLKFREYATVLFPKDRLDNLWNKIQHEFHTAPAPLTY